MLLHLVKNWSTAAKVSLGVLIGISILFALKSMLPESSPVARGAISGSFSCLNCHGKSNSEFPADWSIDCNNRAPDHPAYKGACKDILAFFSAIRVRNNFEERLKTGDSHNKVLSGERLARQYYCFQCHGELGQGGVPNTGALKGYIPGYFGNDFLRLTNNASPAAVKDWISNGVNRELTARFISGFFAKHFIKTQAMQMPEFNSLSNTELDLLVEYVLLLHSLGPMSAATVKEYENLTRY